VHVVGNLSWEPNLALTVFCVEWQWGAFYLFIANYFAIQNIGGAKELVVLL